MVTHARTHARTRTRTELLDYLHIVTKNQSEKVMTKIVDFVSGSSDMDFLERWVASGSAEGGKGEAEGRR